MSLSDYFDWMKPKEISIEEQQKLIAAMQELTSMRAFAGPEWIPSTAVVLEATLVRNNDPKQHCMEEIPVSTDYPPDSATVKNFRTFTQMGVMKNGECCACGKAGPAFECLPKFPGEQRQRWHLCFDPEHPLAWIDEIRDGNLGGPWNSDSWDEEFIAERLSTKMVVKPKTLKDWMDLYGIKSEASWHGQIIVGIDPHGRQSGLTFFGETVLDACWKFSMKYGIPRPPVHEEDLKIPFEGAPWK